MRATSGRRRHAPWILALALTILALALRLPLLGNSLFGDEVGSFFIVQEHSLGGILHLLNGHSVDLTPPLYFLLSRLASLIATGPQLLRLAPLVAGAAAVPLTLWAGRRTVGSWAAAVGALLLALCPFAIFYSTEARAYGLIMGLAALCTATLLEALRTQRRSWWAAYAIVSCACLYTHYTSVFVLAVQALWALYAHPAERRAVIVANLAAAVGFAAWLPTLVRNSRSFGTQVFGILEPFGPRAVGRDLAHWISGHPFTPLAAVPGTVPLVLGAVGVGLATVVAGARLAGRHADVSLSRVLRSGAVLPVLLALSLPAGMVVYSSFGTSVWDLRNLAAATPGLALSAGLLLRAAGPRLGALAATLAVVCAGAGAVQMLAPQHQRPDYLAAARFILHTGSGPNDPVAVVPPPTPGPLSAMDAALTYAGDPGRPLLRIGSPPLTRVLESPPYAPLPATPPRVLAAQAFGHGGRSLFVVAPGAAPLPILLSGLVPQPRATLGPWFSAGVPGRLLAATYVPLSQFVRALGPRWKPVGARRYGGVLPITVYVFARG